MVPSGLLEPANKGFIIDDIQAIVVQILHVASLLLFDVTYSKGNAGKICFMDVPICVIM
jgi:hypothetical protein